MLWTTAPRSTMVGTATCQYMSRKIAPHRMGRTRAIGLAQRSDGLQLTARTITSVLERAPAFCVKRGGCREGGEECQWRGQLGRQLGGLVGSVGGER